jgi:hypothetical protein
MAANGVSDWISPHLAGDPRWAAVKKAADSPRFARATLLREFLLYIAGHELSGHAEEITEQKIGHRVYKRNEVYSPADDNIVRVSAQHLRVKLREYYESEGRDEPWIIEIPKGKYIPLFRKRDDLETPHSQAPLIRSRRFRWIFPSAWLAAGALAIAAFVFGPHLLTSRPISHAAGPQANLVTSIFHDSNQPVEVVMSDEALVLMQAMLGHRFTLDEYTNQSYKQLPEPLKNDHHAELLWRILTTRQIVNLGDAGVSNRIRDSLLQLDPGPTVEIRSAQNMRPRDFLSGNFILLGESSSDPWVEMFGENRFNFQFSPDITRSPRPIYNIHPKPGEQNVYAADLVNHLSYARIAYIPNPTNTGNVLLIAGTSMEGTEAAAEFCLRPDSISILRNDLGVGGARTLPPFEILLATSSRGGAGVGAQVVSARRFDEAP